MKNLILLIATIAIALVSFETEPVAGKDDKFRSARSPIPNRFIVVLHDRVDGYPVADTESAARELNAAYSGIISEVYTSSVTGYAVEMSPSAARELSRDPRVKFVEEDGVVETQSVQPNATWGIARVDQRAYQSPLDTNYEYAAMGQGVNVYVIDTGVNTQHPDFGGRAYDAANLSRDNTPVSECNGHGTHVAGTIGSATFGVAKRVSIYSVRVFPCWGGTASSNVVSGVEWVTRHAVGPAVANMSLGGGVSATLDQAVQNSINRGITYVVAAGNYGSDACNDSPAHVQDAITVGMTDERDFKVDISNFGPCVDIFAPGSAIHSTGNIPNYPMEHIMSGTSTASPHVAGVAALYLERNPTATPQQVSAAIISSSTEGILSEIGIGSPNRFLFSNFLTDPGEAPCSGVEYAGSITLPGGADYKSSMDGFMGRSGNYAGRLSSADAQQFSLSLETKKGGRWSMVAASASGSSANITYKGKSGTYRWRIQAPSGGTYTLCSITP